MWLDSIEPMPERRNNDLRDFDPYDELSQWLSNCSKRGFNLPYPLICEAWDFLKSDPMGRSKPPESER